MIKVVYIFFVSWLFLFSQSEKKNFYIVDKGLYVLWQQNDKKKKIPYKENEGFYFSLKNDSTAIIQEIYNGKPNEFNEYKVSLNYDTAYIKRYSTLGGKKKIKIEKIVFQKVYRGTD